METQNEEVQISTYKFNKSDVLGKGSTGTVYLGYDLRNSKKVAVKAIQMETIDNEVTVYLLSNQKKSLSLLKHPNIVTTYEIIQQKDNCYIVGQYCSGGTLYNYIKAKGRLEEQESVYYLRCLVNGYSECVKLGITHRDLKPSNVLLHEGIPKIIDFGYAQIVGVPKPKMYYNVGSPSYMAPQSVIDNIYSEKSDIWSLGVTFYQMLTGQVPIDTTDIVTTFGNLSKTGVKFPGYISIFCRQIINKCLTPNVDRRINLNQLRKLLNCENCEEPINTTKHQNRPMSQATQRIQTKSIDNLQSFEGISLNKSPSFKQQIMPQTQRQTTQPVPLKLFNQNSPQLTLNNEYFSRPVDNKKVVSPQFPHRPRLLEGARNFKKQQNIQTSGKSPNIGLVSPKYSKPKQVLVRPVSMNSNMLGSFNKNPSINNGMIYSRGTTNPTNINHQINVNPKYPNYNMLNSGMGRPISPAANLQINNNLNGLTRSLQNVGLNQGGFRQTQPNPINKRPQSPGTFFAKYYS